MTPIDTALVEEAAKKSGLLWIRATAFAGPGPTPAQSQAPAPAPAQSQPQAQALWHVWHESAVHVVGDGGEQPVPFGNGDIVTVTARSKDKGGRLVEWRARVAELTPHGDEWTAAVAELKAKRLNAPEADKIAERWARESRVLRLTAEGGAVELPTGSLATAPVATPATTRQPIPRSLPRLLFRRKNKK